MARPPVLSNLAPVRPRVLNYQVNDICNARCVMCFIWKQKREKEMAPAEFGAMLRRPFFRDVQYIGITGGEPTLRPDLSDFYVEALGALPGLKGLSFITNGFSPTRAITHYGRAAEAAAARDVHFSGMVSIDGVGDVHDRVRGRSGAFKRSTKTLDGLRELGIQVIACCTIVRENVYDLHNVLDWGRAQGVYVRFRVAEFINRLYNETATDQIQAFDAAAVKHLVSFYHLLLSEYEHAPEVRRTYESILSRLSGGPRLTACPYQTSAALNLDCEGRFAVCAPKGEPHDLGAWPEFALLAAAGERAEILSNSCATCIHDYHDAWLKPVAAARAADEAAGTALYGDTQERAERAASAPDFTAMREVLLVGWYGTETAGDIAILGGVLSEYLEENPSLRFTVLSLNPAYTRLTLPDLPARLRERVTLAGYNTSAAKQAVERCDAVAMAGGPLMDINETAMIDALFAAFTERGKPALIERCGIGPLRHEGPRKSVTGVARSASRIRVRDSGSRALLRELGIVKEVEVLPDPAVRFIAESGIRATPNAPGPIRCFFRELTYEYAQTTSPEACEAALTDSVRKLLDWFPDAPIELGAMHYFPIGWDDRVLTRRIAKVIGAPDRVRALDAPMSPQEILHAMAEARFNLCMRFHSVLFAQEIGAAYAAIDYTDGGKIAGFLGDRGLTHKMIPLSALSSLTQTTLSDALAVRSAVPAASA